MTLWEQIKDEQEDVIEDEGECDQTICDQDKVKKEPESVLGVANGKWKQPAHYQEKLRKNQKMILKRNKCQVWKK